jgi:serine/threonine protein kinase
MRVRRIFSHFEILELIGEGGQGVVYRGQDIRLGRTCAIKILRSELGAHDTFLAQFEREARLMASITHPHVVKVYSFGEDRGLAYIAMELVDHGSLEGLMHVQGRVPEQKVIDIGIQIAEGLNAGLEQGLLHRDVKPGNILFADPHTAKIVDFGLAVLADEAASDKDEVWATPYYVAPEKLDGSIEDFRADMYSLGATLFHALAGRPPHASESSSMGELRRVKSRPVFLKSYVPEASMATAQVIDRMLKFNPDERFHSYRDLIGRLQFARTQLTSVNMRPAMAAPAIRSAPRPVKRKASNQGPWLIITATLAVVVLLFILTQKGRSGKRSGYPSDPEVVEAQQGRRTDGQTQRDRSDNKRAPSDEGGSQSFPSKEDLFGGDADYRVARKLIDDGKAAQAADVLLELATKSPKGSLKQSWAYVQLTIAEYLAARPQRAQLAARTLGECTLSPDVPRADVLGAFFKKLSSLCTGSGVVKEADAPGFSRSDETVLGAMMLGLKNWSIGEYSKAAPFLRTYKGCTPPTNSLWAGGFKQLAADYLADYTVVESAAATLRDSDGETAQAGLEELQAITEKKDCAPGLKEKSLKLIEENRQRIERLVQEQATAKAVMLAREMETWVSVKASSLELLDQFEFSTAAHEISQVSPKSPQVRKEREVMLERIEWLRSFSKDLVRMLEKAPFRGSVRRVGSSTVYNGIKDATSEHATLEGPYGTEEVPWPEIEKSSLIAIAKDRMERRTSSDSQPMRKFCYGVFLFHFGATVEGQKVLDDVKGDHGDMEKRVDRFLASLTP